MSKKKRWQKILTYMAELFYSHFFVKDMRFIIIWEESFYNYYLFAWARIKTVSLKKTIFPHSFNLLFSSLMGRQYQLFLPVKERSLLCYSVNIYILFCLYSIYNVGAEFAICTQQCMFWSRNTGIGEYLFYCACDLIRHRRESFRIEFYFFFLKSLR